MTAEWATTGTPSHGYGAPGMLDTIESEPRWANKVSTRAEARYMIFWVTRAPDHNSQRCCFPSLPEALAYVDLHPEWTASHVVDLRVNRLAHQFPLVGGAG